MIRKLLVVIIALDLMGGVLAFEAPAQAQAVKATSAPMSTSVAPSVHKAPSQPRQFALVSALRVEC